MSKKKITILVSAGLVATALAGVVSQRLRGRS
jgi:hypothetical protein